MSLVVDGRKALEAMLKEPDVFSRVNPSDYAALAAKLAKKQVIAGGLNRDDQLKLRDTLGEDIYEKVLDDLTAHQAKLLARRLDPAVDPFEISTARVALRHIRAVLAGQTLSEPSTEEMPPAEPATPNKYMGRKAFRTGR